MALYFLLLNIKYWLNLKRIIVDKENYSPKLVLFSSFDAMTTDISLKHIPFSYDTTENIPKLTSLAKKKLRRNYSGFPKEDSMHVLRAYSETFVQRYLCIRVQKQAFGLIVMINYFSYLWVISFL